MTVPARTLRRLWWGRFHPLVRVGWTIALAGRREHRSQAQKVFGIGLMATGFALRRRSRRFRPVYTHVVEPGQTVGIRVFRGESAASEAIVRT